MEDEGMGPAQIATTKRVQAYIYQVLPINTVHNQSDNNSFIQQLSGTVFVSPSNPVLYCIEFYFW